MPGDADPPPEPYEQMRRCLEIAEAALTEAGASMADVVRTRVFITDAGHAPEAMRAHGETFGTVRPACTGVVVGLLDPRWLVEIELDAVVGERGSGVKQIHPASITGKGSGFAEGGSVLDHAFGAERRVHARRRGGVHAPRRRDVRPRPAHRHRARRRAGTRARAAHQPRADAVGARDRDARVPYGGRRRGAARAAPHATSAASRASKGCASAPPARIPSRSSSGSASRRKTATARSSTRCSTSRAAS